MARSKFAAGRRCLRAGAHAIALVALVTTAVTPAMAGFTLARPRTNLAAPKPSAITPLLDAANAASSARDWPAATRSLEAAVATIKTGSDQLRVGEAFVGLGRARGDLATELRGIDFMVRSGELVGRQLAPLLLQQARMADQLGEHDQIVQATEQLLTIDKLSIDAMHLLAKERERQNRREEAYALINRAVVVRDVLTADVPEDWKRMRDRLAPAAAPVSALPVVADNLVTVPIKPDRRRIALVIGNSNYGPTGSLPNPANDARKMTESLKIAGFEVEMLIDGDQNEMKRAISRLGQRLGEAGPGQTGLFFYAGHGIQWRGGNYLIPVDTEIQSEADVDLYAVPAGSVVSQMQESGASTNIIILDACRNAPVMRSSRSGGTGLARLDAPNGTFVAYSTAPGSVAADGAGVNSPFVSALADDIRRPGIPIEVLFRTVRREVLEATDGLQVPWDSSSLLESFEFVPSS